MNLKMFNSLLVVAVVLLVQPKCATSGVVFSEGWESPALNPGATSTLLPGNWSLFSNNGSYGIWRPDNHVNFNSVEPLASPAGGNQLLFLSGTNTGVGIVTTVTIAPETVYTLSSAIGSGQTANNQGWSIQLWADTSGSSTFVGSGGGDTFIGQQYGLTLSAVNPGAGDWASNSVSFDSSTTPNLVGKHLDIFLNNFLNGTSYYDNVTLSAATVPEPGSLAMLAGFGLATLAGACLRRWKTRGRGASEI